MAERIDPNEAQRRMTEAGYVYLDVRSVQEYQQVPRASKAPV